MEIIKPRPKGRPRKIIPSTEIHSSQDKVEESDNSDNKDDSKKAKLKYKHDNIDKVRQQQCERYAKIKGELAVKRLLHTIMSEKYSNDQRKQLLEQLKIKVESNDNNDKQEVTVD